MRQKYSEFEQKAGKIVKIQSISWKPIKFLKNGVASGNGGKSR